MSTDFYSISSEAATITSQPPANTLGVNDTSRKYAVENDVQSKDKYLLRYLNAVDKIFVKQNFQQFEGCTNCGYKNTYTLKDSIGRHIYKAVEESNCCIRTLCNQKRPLDLKIVDENQVEVIHLYRGLRCQCCFCPCCLQRLEIYSPPGHLLGIAQQEWSLLVPSLSVRTADGENLFKIKGPICTFSCCNDSDFPIYNAENGEQVGKISKKSSGLISEALSDDSCFGIDFSEELDANDKAMLLGALFLVEMMYYEKYCSDVWCDEGCSCGTDFVP